MNGKLGKERVAMLERAMQGVCLLEQEDDSLPRMNLAMLKHALESEPSLGAVIPEKDKADLFEGRVPFYSQPGRFFGGVEYYLDNSSHAGIRVRRVWRGGPREAYNLDSLLPVSNRTRHEERITSGRYWGGKPDPDIFDPNT